MAKRPRKPKEEENKPGKHDPRNKLNDLTGKEWLLLTKSYWTTEATPYDKRAMKHPAPFMIGDIKRLISLFTKKDMLVLDPFVGSGTTLISASLINRKSIGIDLNPKYKDLYNERLEEIDESGRWEYAEYIVGDSAQELLKIEEADYIVTSPPYHNILKNKSKGIRNNAGKPYRIGARDGIEYYSEFAEDLGNYEMYEDFISALRNIFELCFAVLKEGKYMTVIMSDFTVNRKEVCVQADVVQAMTSVGFEFCGTTILLQPEKPLFPFGYPYAYKINHDHQNMMTFRKPAK